MATAVCTTEGVHTPTCCTHIFLHISRTQSHSHFSCVCTYMRGSSVCEKCVCTGVVSFLSISLSPFSCLTQLFAVSIRRLSLSHLSVHTFLPCLLVLVAQGMHISARGREVWPSGQVCFEHSVVGSENLTFFMSVSASETGRDILSCASLTRTLREDMALMIRVLRCSTCSREGP